MLNIGIDTRYGLVYEGAGYYGHAIWPTPIIVSAKIIFESKSELLADQASNIFGYRFREDHFDPVSRIRRGRFYSAQGSQQPATWQLQPHPAIPNDDAPTNKGRISKDLETFQGKSIWHEYIKGEIEQPLVLLGTDKRFTIWTIIHIETIVTGEELVTLKARDSFGSLPKINMKAIPKTSQKKVMEALQLLTDEVHKSGPISVIDRSRDAASQVLLSYFKLTGSKAKDLSELAKKLEEAKIIVAANCAKIIARLHARAQPVEREKRKLRDIREQDSELAVYCVGTILCELGWADWI